MWTVETVYPWESALLYVDGAFSRQLAVGRNRIFNLGRKVEVFRVPNYSQTLLTNQIDAMSADKFGLRLAVQVQGRITNPRQVIEQQFQHVQQLHIAAFEAVAGLASELSLDALLEQRAGLGEQLLARLQGKVAALVIEQAAVTQVVLPPEVRRMLTEVERARREGEAALERARGEHAALRSLANAARLLKDNPDLMRLRTLQALSPTGKGATLVLGHDAISPGRTTAAQDLEPAS